jgi:hypothetical protein
MENYEQAFVGTDATTVPEKYLRRISMAGNVEIFLIFFR